MVQTADQVAELEGFIKSLKSTPPADSSVVVTQTPEFTMEGYQELVGAKDELGRNLNVQDPAHNKKRIAYAQALAKQNS